MPKQNRRAPRAGNEWPEVESDLLAHLAARQREQFRAAIAEKGDEGLREIAQKHLHHGGYLIERAFNLANDPDCPYEFDDEVKHEAMQAIVALIRLMHRPIRRRAAGFASADVEFQRFLRGALPRAH